MTFFFFNVEVFRFISFLANAYRDDVMSFEYVGIWRENGVERRNGAVSVVCWLHPCRHLRAMNVA